MKVMKKCPEERYLLSKLTTARLDAIIGGKYEKKRISYCDNCALIQ